MLVLIVRRKEFLNLLNFVLEQSILAPHIFSILSGLKQLELISFLHNLELSLKRGLQLVKITALLIIFQT